MESSEDEEEMSESPRVAAEPKTPTDEEAVPHVDVEMSAQVDIEVGPQDATGSNPRAAVQISVVVGVEEDLKVPTRLTFCLAWGKSIVGTTEEGAGSDDGGDRGADETGPSSSWSV
ncbi:hypothetical protein ACLOJK_009217 [Asimina triloba]